MGSDNFWRASVDHSGLAGADGKLGYRVSMAALDTDGPVGIEGEPDGVSTWINPSISYQFDNGFKVWAWGAFADDTSKRVSNSVWAFGTPDGKGAPFYEFAERGTMSVVFQNFNKSENSNLELGTSKRFSLGRVEADLRIVARWESAPRLARAPVPTVTPSSLIMPVIRFPTALPMSVAVQVLPG